MHTNSTEYYTESINILQHYLLLFYIFVIDDELWSCLDTS
jgi:hypothetical protein